MHQSSLEESNEKKKVSNCWEGFTELPNAYFLFVPLTGALAINLIFLINIVRIVLMKTLLSHTLGGGSGSQAEDALKTIKSTLILFPLLGITNLLFFVNPKDNGVASNFYVVFNATMQSSQGIFLAVIYCFMNSEVQDVVGRRIQRVLGYDGVLTNNLDMRRTSGNILCATAVQTSQLDMKRPPKREEKNSEANCRTELLHKQ